MRIRRFSPLQEKRSPAPRGPAILAHGIYHVLAVGIVDVVKLARDRAPHLFERATVSGYCRQRRLATTVFRV